jgi:hypothetical protein
MHCWPLYPARGVVCGGTLCAVRMRALRAVKSCPEPRLRGAACCAGCRVDLSWCDGTVSEECKNMLTRMLDPNPATRITVAEMLVRLPGAT